MVVEKKPSIFNAVASWIFLWCCEEILCWHDVWECLFFIYLTQNAFLFFWIPLIFWALLFYLNSFVCSVSRKRWFNAHRKKRFFDFLSYGSVKNFAFICVEMVNCKGKHFNVPRGLLSKCLVHCSSLKCASWKWKGFSLALCAVEPVGTVAFAFFFVFLLGQSFA